LLEALIIDNIFLASREVRRVCRSVRMASSGVGRFFFRVNWLFFSQEAFLGDEGLKSIKPVVIEVLYALDFFSQLVRISASLLSELVAFSSMISIAITQ